MKTLYIKSTSILTLTILMVLATFMACNNDESCGYTQCTESCNSYEDFEERELGTAGNWIGVLTSALEYRTRNGSQVLYVRDGSGGTLAYNPVDFPDNLITQGCALRFDIEYQAGSNNNLTTNNGIGIYSDTNPTNAAFRAYFTLNASNLITSRNPPTTIEVPLELASGTSLPSNNFGSWIITPSTSPSADVTNFNALIQNIEGIYFSIDEGGNPAEQWWFDNFCFKQCCPLKF
ncbi:hypothetical protein [Aestuariibaculum sediminum]|uniref:Uncharacterized protein n=1 Tax=Aestuariibaculum sediminum TaxID=2770637 RepID=A0A8J6U8E4_9FLAO|nr:hypothetical protein [Aestuariibaculum sediminum]MBD0831407.1 hypothetical protein [Aestuariibaculum sediminum]